MEKSDVIIVLGGGINKKGEPYIGTKTRVKKAIGLYTGGVAKNIIFSGGKTKPVCSEAEAMKRYAMKINKNLDILLEEKSKDTIGNAYFTKNLLLDGKDWRKIIIVTSDFHVKRTKYIFNKVLGEEYEIKFSKTPTSIRQFLIYKVLGVEGKAMELTKVLLNGVSPGDDGEVRKRIFNFHPAYLSESELKKLKEMSDEEIAKIFGVESDKIGEYRKVLERWFR